MSQLTGTKPTRTQEQSYLDLGWQSRSALFVILAIGAVVMVMPFVWMASTACKPPPELSLVPVRLFPVQPVCGANIQALYDLSPEFNRYMLNTAFVTIVRTVGQLVFCSLAAYGFARFRFPGRNLLFAATLGLLMVPYQAIMVPQFLLVNSFGWRDTMLGIISPNVFSAFALFLLRQAFLQIPRDLEEAAEIDGANPLRILWSVVLPLSVPAIAAFGVISIQAAWNDFLWPLVIANSDATRVVTIGISLLQSERATPWNLIMMGSFIATLPMIALFLALQRYFIEGVAMSGVRR